jgi:2,4-dienoyl-CoA reductase-like NADH-dependent reductase (Old Yellow Enzyme family)
MDANLISQIDAQLQGWGKVMCEIKNDNNVPQFQLWHSGDLGWLCK